MHLFYTNRLDLIKSTTYTFQAVKCADSSIKDKDETLYIIIIYRPPDTDILSFAEEFANQMEMNVNSPCHLIIMEI